jgi:ADP-ribosylglycohydrolase
MLGPIAISGFLQNNSLKTVQDLCREHLFLTHPDAFLARISDALVQLVQSLLFRKNDEPLQQLIADTARQSVGLDLKRLVSQVRSDNEVVGGRYSTACYITDSWPAILYLAYAYADDLKAALLANTNLGGDNVHRGAVLGLILGLGTGRTVDAFFNQLADRQAIDAEITDLIGHIQETSAIQ